GGGAASLRDALRRLGGPRLCALLVPRLPGRLPLVRGAPQRPAARGRVVVPPRSERFPPAPRPERGCPPGAGSSTTRAVRQRFAPRAAVDAGRPWTTRAGRGRGGAGPNPAGRRPGG